MSRNESDLRVDLRVAAAVATSFVIGEEKMLRDERASPLFITKEAHERRQRAARINLDWWDGKVSAADREMVYRYLLDVAKRWRSGPTSDESDE